MKNSMKIAGIDTGYGQPFFLMAGPCIAESRDLLFEVASQMKEMTSRLGIPYIFKSSFDKANRSSINGYRGPGMDKALSWLLDVKKELGLPIVTDIHEASQAREVAEVADVLQIPAFLCRQTDLIVAACDTGRTVNVKKGQFLSPWEVKNIVDKLKSAGSESFCITERGTSFGYNNLVVDARSFPVIRSLGAPVVFDGTHSAQLPGGMGSQTGGMREFIPNQARAAVANGIDGLFMEVHPNPEKGLSDPATMYPLEQMEALLTTLISLDKIIKSHEQSH